MRLLIIFNFYYLYKTTTTTPPPTTGNHPKWCNAAQEMSLRSAKLLLATKLNGWWAAGGGRVKAPKSRLLIKRNNSENGRLA